MKKRARSFRLASSVLTFLLPALAAAQSAKAPPPETERDEVRVEKPVPFPPPAPEMRKLSFLIGTWEVKETWREPERYKRGNYEGYPGEEGYGEQTIREGPGDFSLLWNYEARGPMGKVSATAIVSWDPARRVYDYFQVHSALPGALRLTGQLEKGRLVFRGHDDRTGEKTSVRLAIQDLSTDGWTEAFDEQPEGGRMERVVTTVVRRSAKKQDTR